MKKPKYPVFTEKMCSDGEKIWFVVTGFNLLIEYDVFLNTYERIIIPFANEVGVFYNDIMYCNQKIYLIPGNATQFVVYDTKAKSFDSIEFLTIDNYYGTQYFSGSYYYDEMLYVFPNDHPFVCINTKDNKIVEDCGLKAFSECKSFYCCKSSNEGKSIAISYEHSGLLYCNGYNCEWILEDIHTDKYIGFDFDDEFIYIHKQSTGEILKYNLRSKEILAHSCSSIKEPAFVHFLQGKYLCLDYLLRDEYEVYNADLKRVLHIINEENNRIPSCGGTIFGAWETINDSLCAYYDNFAQTMIVFNSKFEVVSTLIMKIDGDSVSKMFPYFRKDIAFIESDPIYLSDFINAIS